MSFMRSNLFVYFAKPEPVFLRKGGIGSEFLYTLCPRVGDTNQFLFDQFSEKFRQHKS